jgi:hypothetical protein
MCIALLKHYGQVKHAKALDIVVQAINKGDDRGVVKGIVAEESMELPEGALIASIVEKYKPKE